MNPVVLFFLSFLLFQNCNSQALSLYQATSLFGSTETQQNISVSLASVTTQKYINVELKANNNPDVSYLFAECSFSAFSTGSRTPRMYSNQNPSQFDYIDLQAMWFGKQQYINMQIPAVVPTFFYITIFNLDPKNINYVLKVQASNNYKCGACQNGGTRTNPNSCQCNCNNKYQGKYCSRKVAQIQMNQDIHGQVNKNQFLFYYFSHSQQSISFEVTSQNNQDLTLFLQYATFNGEVASYINQAATFELSSSKPTVPIRAALTKSLSLVLTRKTVGSTVFSIIQPKTQNNFYGLINVLLIVLISLAVILAVVVFGVTIFVIIKYKCRPEAVYGQQLQNNSQSVESKKLTLRDVQKYFPQFTMASVRSFSTEESLVQLDNQTDEKIKQNTDNDCVICLCLIQNTESARVTYCKHIFHSQCLINWFKKQLNCPYCRQCYDKQNIIKSYNELSQKNENKLLQGIQIVQAILRKQKSQTITIQNFEQQY